MAKAKEKKQSVPRQKSQSGKGAKESIIDKIGQAETVQDLEQINEDVIASFPDDAIPQEIQEAADRQYQQIVSEELPRVAPEDPEGWVDMSQEEAMRYDKEKKLAGYNRKTCKGLIKKES